MRRTLIVLVLAFPAWPLFATAWHPCARMITPRMDAASAVKGDTLYVMGGRVRSGSGTGDQGLQSVVEAYLPAEDRWVGGFPGLPAPRADMACALIGQRIYLFGGSTADNTLSATVWSWRPGEGTWVVHADTLPVALRGACAVVLDGGSALVVGGLDASGEFLATVYRYGPATGFALEQALSQARSVAAAGGVMGSPVITGGYFHGPLRTTEVFSDRTWVEGPGLPSARGSALACEFGSSLILMGGEGTEGASRDVLVMSSITGAWVPLENMGVARSRMAGGTVGGYVVAAGGTGPVGYEATGTCERADLETVDALAHEPVGPPPLLLSVWPNPFRHEVEISASLRVAGRWSIALHSLDGRMVCRTEGMSHEAYARFRPGADMPTGVYMVSIDADGHVARPIMRIR
ncbi:hypothetical protein JXA88_14010 [Candidatus Fermentibacteria bacterium]|nr:hypothetical protein [Candidatus Fermentibacteria bacterium]